MGEGERYVYTTLREGLQIFKTINDLLSDKVGMKKKLVEIPVNELTTDPELAKLRDFCQGYAAYASSLYISKKIDVILAKEEYQAPEEERDLSMLILDDSLIEKTFMKQMLVPIYTSLIKHGDTENVFTPSTLPSFVKDVFDKYVEMTAKNAGTHPKWEKMALEGYQFRIMDEFLVLEGFMDKSAPHVSQVEQKISFKPTYPNEIAGNKEAKRNMTRWSDRIVLYDLNEQKNPLLEMGGLPWSVLFDGLPGTGKTSMFRMMMTLVSDRCEQIGLPDPYIFLIDQSIKDEYYGKTGKILGSKLEPTKDPTRISLGFFDDIDLLTSTRHDAQGADNDINNIIMQYLDGAAYSVVEDRGSVMNFAASNDPTGLDNAMRNRFRARLLVDGPITAEDFADINTILLGKFLKSGLLKMKDGYEPFATQDRLRKDGTWTGGDVASFMAEDFHEKYKSASILDFGTFMAELKEKNENITGRSVKAISESIRERAANFDIPREWFDNHSHFLDLSYDKKVKKLAELYTPITPPVMFEEAQKYFDSEQRYAVADAERHIKDVVNSLRYNQEGRIQFLKEIVQEFEDDGKTPSVVQLKTLEESVQGLKMNAMEDGKK